MPQRHHQPWINDRVLLVTLAAVALTLAASGMGIEYVA